MALYLSKSFAVGGVAMISAPQDFWVVGDRVQPANWVKTRNFATPAARFVGLVHTNEPEYQLDVRSWAILGMKGELVDAAAGRARLATTQFMNTNIAPNCMGVALVQMGAAAHGATAFDKCTSASLTEAWLRLAEIRR